MSTAAPFLETPPTAVPQRQNIWDFAESCLQLTAGAVHEARAATPAELSQAIAAARQEHAREIPCDLLEVLARVQGNGEEHLSDAITHLGNKIDAANSPHAPLIPFAGKLIAPSSFYESFDQIHKIARILLTPIVFAEDTDAIGVASVNPLAAAILADQIRDVVYKRFGIRPFVTLARIDYETWAFLTRKHFEL
jgi:hypothetical protein